VVTEKSNKGHFTVRNTSPITLNINWYIYVPKTYKGLNYKFKVNFVKLPLIWIDLWLKLVFEIVTAGHKTGCRSVVNCASCSLQFPLTHSDAVCGIQNATKQCISRYHLHTGLFYWWSAMDKTLDCRRLAHLITNFHWCRHEPQCTCECVAEYWVLHAVAHDGGPLYEQRHC